MRYGFRVMFLRLALVLVMLVVGDRASAEKTGDEPKPVEQQTHYMVRIRPFRADEKIPVIVLWSDGVSSEVVDARDFHDALFARNSVTIYTVPRDLIFSFAENAKPAYANLVADRLRTHHRLGSKSRKAFVPPHFSTSRGDLSKVAEMHRLSDHLHRAPSCATNFSLTGQGEGV